MFFWHSPSRFFLFTAGILLLLLSAIVANEQWQHRIDLIDQQRRSVIQQSELLAKSVIPLLQRESRQQLLAQIAIVRDNPVLQTLGIYNAGQELLASVGTPGPLSQALTEQIIPYYAMRADDGLFIVELPLHDNGREIGIFHAAYQLGTDTFISRSGWQSILIAGIGYVLLLGLLLIVLLPLQREYNMIEKGVRQLSQGQPYEALDTDVITGRIAREINVLAQQLAASQQQSADSSQKLQQRFQRMATLLDKAQLVIWKADPDTGRFSEISAGAEVLTGYTREQWLAPDFIEHTVHPGDRQWLLDYFRHPGTDHQGLNMDLRIKNQTGDWQWLRMHSMVELSAGGSVPVGLLVDNTAEKNSEHLIAYIRDYDQHTGLLNRDCLLNRLQELIDQKKATDRGISLLVLDVKDSHFINSCYGPEKGAEYLAQIAYQLNRFFTDGGIIGRLGNDEFGVILPDTDALGSADMALRLLKKLNDSLFDCGDQQLLIQASIGIAVFPDHGFDSAELHNMAEIALSRAKRSKYSTYHLFEEGYDNEYDHFLSRCNRLQKAIKNNQIEMHYQPVIDMVSGAIHYYEVLAMLADGQQPGRIVQMTEVIDKFGMTDQIERQMIADCMQMSRSSISEYELPLIVRLGEKHLFDMSILDYIQATAKTHKLNLKKLFIAIDAMALREHSERLQQFFGAVQKIGCKTILDQFTTDAYCCENLQQLPIDFIRIHDRLVRRMNWSHVDRTLVGACVSIAGNIGVPVLTHGVDKLETVTALKKLNILYGQGSALAQANARLHEISKIVITGNAA